jgi:MFS family permease
MQALLIPLSSLFTGTGLLVVGIGLFFSVLGLRANLAGFSGMVTGLIMSAYFVGYMLGTYICPAIVRRVGHIRAFAAMASLASTMPILHALWIDPWFWGFLRLVTGVCLVGLYLVIESWLNTLAPRHQRGKVIALYLVVNFVAMAAGQFLIMVGGAGGFLPFALISVLFSFALLPITLAPVAQPAAVEPPKLSLKELYRISPLGVGGSLASGLLYGAFYGMGAVYAQGVGLSTAGVAAFMAAAVLGGAALQWPIGVYSDKHDRRYVLLWVSIVSGILAIVSYVLSQFYISGLTVLAFLYGGFMFTLYGLSVAHVNDLIDSSRVLEVTGGLLLVHGVGAALSPTLAGMLMDTAGAASLMLSFALVLALLAYFTIQRIRAAPPVPPAEKSDYVALTGTEPMLEVHPNPVVEESAPDDLRPAEAK